MSFWRRAHRVQVGDKLTREVHVGDGFYKAVPPATVTGIRPHQGQLWFDLDGEPHVMLFSPRERVQVSGHRGQRRSNRRVVRAQLRQVRSVLTSGGQV